jgi:hypothetical protein
MIEFVAAAATVAVAAFRYLTVHTLVKHADKKDIPAITRAIYSRHRIGQDGNPYRHRVRADDAEGASAAPSAAERT